MLCFHILHSKVIVVVELSFFVHHELIYILFLSGLLRFLPTQTVWIEIEYFNAPDEGNHFLK